jgi:hypothetical protein
MFRHARSALIALLVFCLALRAAAWLVEPLIVPIVVAAVVVGIAATVLYGRWT